jgi:hypothetical protein
LSVVVALITKATAAGMWLKASVLSAPVCDYIGVVSKHDTMICWIR